MTSGSDDPRELRNRRADLLQMAERERADGSDHLPVFQGKRGQLTEAEVHSGEL